MYIFDNSADIDDNSEQKFILLLWIKNGKFKHISRQFFAFFEKEGIRTKLPKITEEITKLITNAFMH